MIRNIGERLFGLRIIFAAFLPLVLAAGSVGAAPDRDALVLDVQLPWRQGSGAWPPTHQGDWVNDFMRDVDGSIWQVQATMLPKGTLRFQGRELSSDAFVAAIKDEGVTPHAAVRVMIGKDVEDDTSVRIFWHLREAGYAVALVTRMPLASVPSEPSDPSVKAEDATVEDDVNQVPENTVEAESPAEIAPEVKKLVDGMEHADALIRDIRVAFTLNVEQYSYYANPGKEFNRSGFNVLPDRGSYLWAMQGEKWFSFAHYSTPAIQGPGLDMMERTDTVSTEAYDGKTTRSMVQELPGPARGTIRHGKGSPSSVTGSPDQFERASHVNATYAQVLRNSATEFEGYEQVGGQRCAVLSRTPTNHPGRAWKRAWKVWVDPERGYRPLRIQLYKGGILRRQYDDIVLKEVGEGIWYPTGGTLKTYWRAETSQSGKPKAMYVMTANQVKVNAGLPDAMFRDVFSPGIGVRDADTGERYVYDPTHAQDDSAVDDEDVVLLNEERVYEIAKAEVADRYPELTVERLLERGVDYKEPRPGPISVKLRVSESEQILLETPFLTLSTYEIVSIKMGPSGEIAPTPYAVQRETLAEAVPDVEQEAARIEASKEAGYDGYILGLQWTDAPLSVVLDHCEEISGSDVIQDASVPQVLITLHADRITEAELMDLVTVLLKEQRIVLEQNDDGTIRVFSKQSQR